MVLAKRFELLNPLERKSSALPIEISEYIILEEEVGFEPTEDCSSIAFKAIAINHSAIPPYFILDQERIELSDIFHAKENRYP